MQVKIKKLTSDAVLPSKAHPTDAGFDLVATDFRGDNDGNVVYNTGLAFEIPEGYVGLIFPRSSNAKKDLLLSNSVGVIDSHYRGEVSFKFKRTKFPSDKYYDIGDRIGQIIIIPIPTIEFIEADGLSETDRGTDGYGSTGK